MSNSLLSRGAPPAGTKFDPPWWRDREKLLAAVLNAARDDKRFARRVAEAMAAEVATESRADKGLRNTILDALKQPAKGRRPTSYNDLTRTLYLYDRERSKNASGHGEALIKLKEAGLIEKSERQIERLLKMARETVLPEHRYQSDDVKPD